jgi:cell division protein FtsQ
VTDPRIQARRVTVARQHGRRRRRWILAGLVVAVLFAGSVALVHSSMVGARHIRVFGASNIASSSVVAAARLSGDPPLVDLDPAAIASRVEHLPWVLTAAVRILWPSTVAIRISERIPVAAVAVPGTRSSYAVCDVTGRVLEIVPARPGSLPVVALTGAGAGEPGEPGSSLPVSDRLELQVAGDMPESMVPAVRDITGTPVDASLELTDHLTAIIGDAAGLPQKFVSLATVLAHGQFNGFAGIDLRVPTAPVLIPEGSSPNVSGNVGG